MRFTLLRAPGPDIGAAAITTAAQVADALIGGMAASLAIAALFIFAFPQQDESEETRTLASRQIGSFLRSESDSTREWLIRARTGIYFRARTLGWLGEASTRNNRDIRIRITLLDVRDPDVVRRHLQYRNSAATGVWDVRRVVLETCATVLACIVALERYPRLRIEPALKPDVWVVSLDLSSQHVLVCGPNTGHPAIVHSSSSAFYDSFRGEFETSFALATRLDLSVATTHRFESAEHVRRALDDIGLGSAVEGVDECMQIVAMIQAPERSNQY
ncbi:hypothetical protein [Pseudonocardia yunnanensis]|uniref:Uncharacterized protein n=1 Tax=Pseudonocardia yunnanensis TaxID=58107 RepID=A0ABW4FE58_9PSEU